MYRVFLERAAEKELKQLSAQLHNRVMAAIQKLARNPRPAGCRNLTGADRDWRIRVGNYRIVYEIDDRAETVRVNRVRHRREFIAGNYSRLQCTIHGFLEAIVIRPLRGL